MSINYDNTKICTNDSQCKLAYSNDNGYVIQQIVNCIKMF